MEAYLMGASTKISWADASWSPITGCSPCSEGCRRCYAAAIAKRFWGDRPFSDVRFHPDRLDQPLRWRKPRKIFVVSMGDLFHDDTFLLSSPFNTGLNFSLNSYIPYTDHPMLDAIFAVMERSLNHIFILLTKRPENMSRYFSAVQKHKLKYADKFKDCPTEEMRNSPAAQDAKKSAVNPIPNHIWIGVTAENQKQADKRIPILLDIPAAVRFVSIEPMLGKVELGHHLKGACMEHCESIMQTSCPGGKCITRDEGIDWVICGGESGPGAKPMHPDWARSIRDQCQKAGVPFFFKQWGEWIPITQSVKGTSCRKMISMFPDGEINGKLRNLYKELQEGEGVQVGGEFHLLVGKKKAGRILDGKEWTEFPGHKSTTPP